MSLTTARLITTDQRGNIGMLVAIGAAALIGSAGIAVDSLLAYSAQSQMQKALDAAGLAAGKIVQETNVKPEAEKIFKANFPAGENMVELKSFDVTPSTSGDSLKLKASAEYQTRLMRVFGHDTVTVSAESSIQRAVRQMELVLVMDNTGSMKSDDKIGAMKTAARDLVNLIYGEAETHPNLWVGLVPYSATVNIGAQHKDWLASGDQIHQSPSPFAPETWKGCVMARPVPYDQTDDPPSVKAFASYLYPKDTDNVWPPVKSAQSYENNGTGPNLGCGPAIHPLMPEKSDVIAAIDEMQPWHRGGTTGNLGLVWGWRAISPQWRGLWGDETPAAMPLDYNSGYSDKVVVLLTDGQNQFYDWPGDGPDPEYSDFTAYGRLAALDVTTLDAGRKELDKRMTKTCTSMKEKGIIIYTITFGSVPDTATKNLYKSCATKPEYYFSSPDNKTLATAFRTIGLQLSNLRIAH